MTRLLIGIIVSLLLTSCGFRCKKSDYEEKPLDTELLSYFGVFKTGNYWVYENTAKDKKDSIYVTDYSRFFYDMKGPCNRVEKLTFTLEAIGNDVITKDKVCMELQNDQVGFQTCIDDSLFFNIVGGVVFGSQLYSTSSIEVVSSVKLNSDTYTGDIILILSSDHIQSNDTIYFMKDKGIIGWQKNNDTYNVTQYLIL